MNKSTEVWIDRLFISLAVYEFIYFTIRSPKFQGIREKYIHAVCYLV